MRILFNNHSFFIVITLLLLTIIAISYSSPVQAEESIDTNRYFYNQLNDLEKEIYDAFYNMPDNEDTLTISDSKFPKGISDIEATDIVLKAYSCISLDNPSYELKWRINFIGSHYEDKGVYSFQRLRAFTNDYTYQKSQEKLSRWIDAIGTEGDRYTKIRKIYDIMANNIEYDWTCDYLLNKGVEYNDTIIGATVYGRCICGGYCSTFKTLCDAVGVPCIEVGNYCHGWNYVQMEDGKWYAVDTTNCIPEGYKNILLGMNDENYYNNYGNTELYHGRPEFGFTFPELSDNNYVYNGDTTDFSYTIAESTFKEQNGHFVFTENLDGTYSITDYYGEANGKLIIPTEYKGKPVTTIGEGAFYFCTGFTGTLEIPNTITRIERLAFARCEGLTGELILPDSLTFIGEVAFLGCKNINDKISVPANCTVDVNAFKLDYYNDATILKRDPVQEEQENGENESVQKPKEIKKGTITITSDTTYNGKKLKPSIIVKDEKGNIIPETFYTTTYSNNKNVGKATVKVIFKGNYTGTLKTTFTIKPPTTKITKLNKGSKSISVKWNKQKKQVTGYQIQYSTNKNFKSPKKVTIKKNTKNSTKLTKLKKNKKYFVRIRTYKTLKVNGKKTTIYSNWSNIKNIKTK